MSNDACAGLNGYELANEIERDAIARSTFENQQPVTGLTIGPFTLLAAHLSEVDRVQFHPPEWSTKWPGRAKLNCRGFPVILVRQPKDAPHD